MTIELFEKHRTAIEEKFGNDAWLGFSHASQTVYSIARHYGGCKINGKTYTYFPQDDLLVRDDVVKFVAKLEKESEK